MAKKQSVLWGWRVIAFHPLFLELTPYALHELVKAIYVDAPNKSSGKRTQHIHIQYDGLGFIPLNELLASEKA